MDAIYLSSAQVASGLNFNIHTEAVLSHTEAEDVFTQGEWAYVCGTWDGTIQTIYANGAEVSNMPMDTLIVKDTTRGECFIGMSTYSWDPTTNAQIDEVQISNVGRSAEWVQLAYENQKPVQALVSIPVPEGCVETFGLADTTIQAEESGSFSVSGIDDCAHRYYWSSVSGGTPTMLDDPSLTLTGSTGRINADTTLTYRFSALYDTGWASVDLTVEVTNTIPDPAFTIASSPVAEGETWDGLDTVTVTPTITNLAEIQALDPPADSIIYTWTTSGVSVTKSLSSSNDLLMRSPSADGNLTIMLCLNNGGQDICDSMTLAVERIEPLEVTYPNGGEDITANDTITITWVTNDPSITQVHLQYLLTNTWLLIATYEENTGSYDWVVPNENSATAKVRVASDAGGMYDESDTTFTISGAVPIATRRDQDKITFFVKGVGSTALRGDYRSIIISDLSGSLISELPINSDQVVWNLSDTQGRRVSKGIYFFQFVGKERSKKLQAAG
jgi:hypothetical protein